MIATAIEHEVWCWRRCRDGNGSSGRSSSYLALRPGVACDNRRSQSRGTPCRRFATDAGGRTGTRPRTPAGRSTSWRAGRGSSHRTRFLGSFGNRPTASGRPAGTGRGRDSQAGSRRGRPSRAGGGRIHIGESHQRNSLARGRTASLTRHPRPPDGQPRHGPCRGRGSSHNRRWGSLWLRREPAVLAST
jgi:hypothetical protein